MLKQSLKQVPTIKMQSEKLEHWNKWKVWTLSQEFMRRVWKMQVELDGFNDVANEVYGL